MSHNKYWRPAAVWLLSLVAVCMHAAVPTGYYNSLNGKSGAKLKTAIYDIVHNFTRVSSYSDLPRYFVQTDVYPESNRWWDMYSDIPLYAPSFSGLNREHSFPKSWWGGSTTVGAYVDLNHLYPSERDANTAKSNYPLGVVSNDYKPKFDNGVSTVGYPVNGQGGGAQYVFEPADEYKGDFARTYFYMVTCYQNLTWKYTYMVSQNLWPTLNNWSVDLLLKWHNQDPVSEKETLRNEAVYKIQNNRNPFIDYPELVDHIWGRKQDVPFHESGSTGPVGDPVLVTPVQDMSLDFGQVALGNSTTARLWFKGSDIFAPITVRVYRDDAAMFSIPTQSIAANLVNAADGYWLNVTYTPTSLGQHSSRLLIQVEGISGTRGIALRGECLPKPELTACTATAPTDVTATSYVANWTAPAGEMIDYYVVTRTRYIGANVETEELVAEDCSLQIDEFDKSDRETYSVQSVRLGYRSPMSNAVVVDHAGVTDISCDLSPMAVITFAGGLRIIAQTEHTNVCIYDATGRRTTLLPAAMTGTVVMLPPGVYLIVSDQHKQPLKAVIP